MSNTFEQEKLKDFTVIRNSIFRDYSLSAKAKGVACQLLALPLTWDYSVKGLVALFDDGEASIRSALCELEQHGYLRREQDRADGRFGKIKYIITDTLKCEKPHVENPHAVNPQAGNSVAENHAQLNTNELSTYKSNTKGNSRREGTFVPPTLEEIKSYISEKGYSIDAERFYDYYLSNGWKVGKNKMKDWKAAVRTWERRDNADKRDQGTDNSTEGADYSDWSAFGGAVGI